MKLGNFMQLGIVSANGAETVEQFKKFGFEKWESFDFHKDTIPGASINGVPGGYEVKIFTYRGGEMEIEVIEPVGESFFMDWVREHGTGVHHIAFKPAEDYDQFMKEFREEEWTANEVLDGTGQFGFSYLNTEKALGFNIEIHKGGAPE